MEANFWFEFLSLLVTAPIWVIVVLRASKFDSRVRKPVMLTFLLLAFSAFGLSLSHLLPDWLYQACAVAFRASVFLMLLIGQDRWVGGPPRELLKPGEQERDRRTVVRRRADRDVRLAAR